MKPTLGRIVHVHYFPGDVTQPAVWAAAVVVEVVDEVEFHAYRFPTRAMDARIVMCRRDEENGGWRWPPRED
jgi:hypothetical protein